MSRSYILHGLSVTPVIFARLYERLSVGMVDTRPEPDRFTPREVIAHLADWEQFFRERITGTHTEADYIITPRDEAQMAIDNGYARQDPAKNIARFAEEREETIRLIDTLDDSHWAKTATHPERGVLTIYDQVGMILGHDVYHIEQVTAAFE